MIPGSIAAVFVDELPVQVLFDPRIVADSVVSALFVGGWGLLSEGVEAIPESTLLLGLALVFLLYYVGTVAVILSVVSLIRNS